MQKIRAGFIFLFVAVLLLLWAVAIVVVRYERIYPGVSVAGVDVGSLTQLEAQHRLLEAGGALCSRTITINADGKLYEPKLSEIGAFLDAVRSAKVAQSIGRQGGFVKRLSDVVSSWRHGINLPAVYSFDEGLLSAYVKAIAKEINCEPRDAKITFSNGAVEIVPDVEGRRLDQERAMPSVIRAVNSGGLIVTLQVDRVKPGVTAADLQGIDSLIASFSTPTAGSTRSRLHNLRLACKAIDGSLIKPGQLFSYNERVGPRLPRNGFMEAPVFIKGQVRRGPGGGVCQVSSTLYNAALLAGLRVRQRSHHSMPVHYVAPGRDATVEYGLIDLKFENTTAAPIYISAGVENGRVVVRMFGKKANDYKIEIETKEHSLVPYRVVEQVDKTLAPGESVVRDPGRVGHRVKVYRIVRQGSQVVRRELISTDYYPPANRVIAVGVPAKATDVAGE